MGRTLTCALLLAAVFITSSGLAQNLPPRPEFISLESARPVIAGLGSSLPPELAAGKIDDASWSRWVRASDEAIRKRLEKGEEDTLTNLLRFGVTFTKEYRIDNQYLARLGHSSLVNAFADKRADDLIRALSAPGSNEGLMQMRLFLEKKGFSFKTAADRKKIKAHLLANLARMKDEFIGFAEKLKSAGPQQQSELYSDRGISLDTNLWPDFGLHQQLQRMLKEGLLKPGSIHRVAIIGPGLDFANKESGSDFYPPQTIQPFAVIDSLAQLGLADPKTVELFTFDISSSVNVHIARARKKAQAGQSYVGQLTWDKTVPRSEAYLAEFTPYWKALGTRIGASVSPLPVPAAVADQVMIRAVKIAPRVVSRVTPVDMNIVYQRVSLGEADKFDLIIGTNIFVYYGAFEQSLARSNLASMMKPGAFLLTNDLLADAVPSHLVEQMRTQSILSVQPPISDYIFCYRRQSP
jgi:hypothetical protein